MSSSGTLFPCAICFETAADPVVTRCGHLFCWPCLDQWLHIGNADCPVCKGRVDENKDGDIIPLYGVSSSEKAGPSSASQESSLSGDANPSLSHAAPKPSPMHQSEQRQQQQHQHAFHRRTARPTPTDVPGGRRAGNNGWSSYVRGMVVGGPTLFIGDFYIFLLITLSWAALTKGGPLIKDHVLPVVKRAYRHVLSRLREGHAPDTRERGSATAADRSIRTNVALSVRWVLFFAAVSFLIYQAIALCLWIRSSRLLNFYVL